ncbi:hypothetical protein [Saccharothrix obliqua]|uniref:hypothetical protein n=1 Tax=Saccharothrix obliqua TaxID=2861747 RepID=UPI001C5DDF25|nr:hypothetical protein [Saccharothrix obliqua]MBW4718403.1 hypothetical protein [Saccharothrix obliqua]
MRDPSSPPPKSVVVALFAVAAAAVLGAGALTAVAVTGSGPDRAAVVESDDRPSPTPPTTTERPAGPPLCLVGSWESAEERSMVRFYTDNDPILFTGSGRRYEFRPDGTGTERQDNVVLTGSYQGNELRIVANGTNEFRWTATDRQLTYVARTATTMTYTMFDQRGLIATQPLEPEPALNEVDDYTCEGTRAVESNASGYRARWVRTDGSGVYG